MTNRRRVVRVALIGALSLGAMWAVLTLPVATRQGVNQQVSTYTIPLYVKGIDFLHRHYHYQLLAKTITRTCRSDQERALAIFEWTRRNIRKTPRDWPAIDDHVLNIIIRGHGLGDQMADVFTTLTTYAGVRAFWQPGPVAISFVRIDGRWTMFDVANGLIFTDRQGRLADVHELLVDPALIRQTAGLLRVGGLPYDQYVARFRSLHIPAILRAEQQMPLPRLFFEARRLLHLTTSSHMPLSVKLMEASASP